MDWRAVTRRRRRLAVLMAAPAVVVALGLVGIEAWRSIRPRSSLFAQPFAYSLADAIATGNVPHAYAYIRAGQDPNAPMAVRHPGLTEGRWVLASPLLWSVAVGNTEAVKMLLGYGARMDRAANQQAACLAEALDKRDIARLLRTHSRLQPTGECRQVERDRAPLLRMIDGT